MILLVLISEKGSSHLMLEEKDLVPGQKQWKEQFS